MYKFFIAALLIWNLTFPSLCTCPTQEEQATEAFLIKATPNCADSTIEIHDLNNLKEKAIKPTIYNLKGRAQQVYRTQEKHDFFIVTHTKNNNEENEYFLSLFKPKSQKIVTTPLYTSPHQFHFSFLHYDEKSDKLLIQGWADITPHITNIFDHPSIRYETKEDGSIVITSLNITPPQPEYIKNLFLVAGARSKNSKIAISEMKHDLLKNLQDYKTVYNFRGENYNVFLNTEKNHIIYYDFRKSNLSSINWDFSFQGYEKGDDPVYVSMENGKICLAYTRDKQEFSRDLIFNQTSQGMDLKWSDQFEPRPNAKQEKVLAQNNDLWIVYDCDLEMHEFHGFQKDTEIESLLKEGDHSPSGRGFELNGKDYFMIHFIAHNVDTNTSIGPVSLYRPRPEKEKRPVNMHQNDKFFEELTEMTILERFSPILENVCFAFTYNRGRDYSR